LKEFRVTTKKQFKVIIDDKEFLVNKPKVSDSMTLNSMLKDVDENSAEATEVMIQWLDGLGLPSDMVKDMYQSDLQTIIEEFLADTKKK
jgi:uncharacterized protein (DUF2126 family)